MNLIVYGLKDPRNSRVRYVGISPEPERRLGQHIYDSKRHNSSPKDKWIVELVSLGLRPQLDELETVTIPDWPSREQFWINHYRAQNIDLTNVPRCDGSGRPQPMITEKTCKGPCGQKLPIDLFHWKSKRKGTRQARCKDCMSKYGHEHYVANSQQYKDRANTRLKTLRSENRNLRKSHLSSNPCSKCGEANPRVLDISITSAEINNLNTDAFKARLAESVVLCKNCQASQ